MRGLQLGAFDLLHPLAAGGMGTVFAAVHRRTGVRAAVKVLAPSRFDDDAAIRALTDEIASVAGLDHPHIIRVFDQGRLAEAAAGWGLLPGSPYLVMEQAELTLDDLRGALTWPGMKDLLLAMLDALAHAHARGVVHRDIKPSNVLIRRSGTSGPGWPLLTDFGISASLTRLATGEDRPVFGGTPPFMAPEQFRDDGFDQGPWTDLYALACLAWDLLCGAPPYAGDWLAQRAGHLYAPPPALTPRIPVPDGLHPWLEALLAKAPPARFQRAADEAAALAALPDPPVSAGPTVTWVRAAPPAALTYTATAAPRAAATPDMAPPRRGTARAPVAPPAETWRAPGLRTRTDPVLLDVGLGLYGLRTVPFVDREPVRDQLWSTLVDCARSREPRAVLLSGPVGVGRSALAKWLTVRAAEAGVATPLVVTHDGMGGPLDGFAGLVRRQLQLGGGVLDAARDRASTLLHRFGADDGDPDVLVDLAARRLLRPAARWQAALQALRWWATRRAVVLLLDDASLSPDSLGLALHVLRNADDLPLLLVLTVGEEDLAPAASPLLAALRDHPASTEIALAPLADEDLRTLVRDLLRLEPRVAARVEERAAGNPLFAIQLVGQWVRAGVLRHSPVGFRLEGPAPAMPDDVRDIWTARLDPALDALRPERALALEVAAVLGTRVDTAEWREACARAGAEAAAEALDHLASAGLVRRSELTLNFAHGLLRDALLDRARAGQRLDALHRACGAMLEEAGADRGRIGLHLHLGGDHAGALEHLIKGAYDANSSEDARRALMLVETWNDAMRALSVEADDPRRVWGWIAEADAQNALGMTEAATEIARRALALARRSGGDAEIALASQLLGRIQSFRGDRALATATLQEAAEAGQRAGMHNVAGRCLRVLAQHAVERGDPHAGLQLAAESSRAYERAESDTGTANAALIEAYAALLLGLWTRAAAAIQRGRTWAETRQHRGVLSRAALLAGDMARLQGDLDAAEAAYREAVRHIEALGALRALGQARMNLALVAVGRGSPEALSSVEAAIGNAREVGWRTGLGLGLLARSTVLVGTDSWDQAMDEVHTALEPVDHVDYDIPWLCAIGSHRADTEEAAARYRALARRVSERLSS